jgi:hypothetical protein
MGARGFMLRLEAIAPALGSGVQPGILGQSHAVTHAVPVAPVEYLLAAKAGVAAQDDTHLGPGMPQGFDQQRKIAHVCLVASIFEERRYDISNC